MPGFLPFYQGRATVIEIALLAFLVDGLILIQGRSSLAGLKRLAARPISAQSLISRHIHSAADLENRLQCDLEYLSLWSLRLDLQILLSTVRVVVHDSISRLAVKLPRSNESKKLASGGGQQAPR